MKKLSIIYFLFIFLLQALFCENVKLELSAKSTKLPIYVIDCFTSWKKVPMLYDSSNSVHSIDLDLKSGSYKYCFVQGESIFRDPTNSFYGGAYSNSLLVVHEEKPRISRILPENGSILDVNDSLIYIFYKTSNSLDLQKSVFLINGEEVTPSTVDTNILGISVKDLSNGLHSFYFQLVNIRGKNSLPFQGAYKIKKINSPPQAEAGYAYIAQVGETIKLCGLNSSDPDYDPIRLFKWRLCEESKWIEFLTSDTLPEPKIKVLKEGVYQFTLSVSDGEEWSKPDTGLILAVQSIKKKIPFSLNEDSLVIGNARLDLQKVSLVGEFNDWDPSRHPLEKNNGIWETELFLQPGIYEYKFILNDCMKINDPANQAKIEDRGNGYNSLIHVTPPDSLLEYKIGIENNKIFIYPQNATEILHKRGKRFGFLSTKIYKCNDPNNIGNVDFYVNGSLLLFKSDDSSSGNYFYLYLKAGDYYSPLYSFLQKSENDSLKIFKEDFPPNWVQRSSLYEIQSSSLSLKNKKDKLKFIRNQIEFFKKSNMQSLELIPIYPSSNADFCAPTDFFQVDSKWIGNMTFSQFLDDLHKHEKKLFFNFIAAYSGDQHPFFISAYSSPNSFFREFYQFCGKRKYKYHNGAEQLPLLNYNSTVVRQYMKEAALYWVKQGVDAFRCDAAGRIPNSFWEFLRKEIKRINPSFVLLNDSLKSNPSYYQNGFDFVFDTRLLNTLIDFSQGKRSHRSISLNFLKYLLNLDKRPVVINYLDSRVTTKLLTDLGEDNAKPCIAFLILTNTLSVIPSGMFTESKNEWKLPFLKIGSPRNNRFFEYVNALIAIQKKLSNYGPFKLSSDWQDDLIILSNYKYSLLFNFTDKYIDYQSSREPKKMKYLNFKDLKIKDTDKFWGNTYKIPPKSFIILEGE